MRKIIFIFTLCTLHNISWSQTSNWQTIFSSPDFKIEADEFTHTLRTRTWNPDLSGIRFTGIYSGFGKFVAPSSISLNAYTDNYALDIQSFARNGSFIPVLRVGAKYNGTSCQGGQGASIQLGTYDNSQNIRPIGEIACSLVSGSATDGWGTLNLFTYKGSSLVKNMELSPTGNVTVFGRFDAPNIYTSEVHADKLFGNFGTPTSISLGAYTDNYALDIQKYARNGHFTPVLRVATKANGSNCGGGQGASIQFGTYDNSQNIRPIGEIACSLVSGSTTDGWGTLNFYTYKGTTEIKNMEMSPTGNVAVFGKFEAAEIKVTTTPTADFVFEPSYDLRTLSETEKFIKENKHLPEIESATEMKENGVNIAEFQIKLLQKIEELTLHVIEQQKQIEELKKQNQGRE